MPEHIPDFEEKLLNSLNKLVIRTYVNMFKNDFKKRIAKNI